MTAIETPDTGDAAGTTGVAEPGVEGDVTDAAARRDRLVRRLALALTVLPFVVGAVALLVAVGGDYYPHADYALTEMQTRSVGRDEVLVGLYSRDDWNHPGPALFYLLAPFYRLTGGMSVGANIGALAINGAAVVGMGLLARRRGGTPLMLVTLLCSSLLVRMLGADFVNDPWNCFVTTLPFGLLVMLSWSMWRGDAWALPVGAAVTTFLAQTHVGFVALATPVLAWGVVGLLTTTVTEPDGEARSAAVRRGVRAAGVAAVVLAVGWLPAAVEALKYKPSNLVSTFRWFRNSEDGTHSLVEGWRVMSGQFSGAPEWLTVKRDGSLIGESPFMYDTPLPWMLLVVVVAGVVLWRRRVAGAGSLLATLTVTFAVGVVAVARTVGLAFDYRLRWTFIPAMLGLVVVGWAGWTVVAERWPRAGSRVLTAVSLAGLAVVSGVNVVTAATAGTPMAGDSAAMRSITTQVLDNLPDDDGTVLVTDALHTGAGPARGLVLQLERRGIDVGVPKALADEYGRSRVTGLGEIGTVLVVTRDENIEEMAANPDLRLIAEWRAVPEDEANELLAERAEILADMEAGRLSLEEGLPLQHANSHELTGDGTSTAYHVAVFVDEASSRDPSPPD